MAIADKYGIPVVEDAAEGMGSRFNGQVLGTFGKLGMCRLCVKSCLLVLLFILMVLRRSCLRWVSVCLRVRM